MTTETKTLPDKLSELIRVAIGDLEKCEVDPLYEIDMHRWHYPSISRCCVCLAGACLAMSVGIDPSEQFTFGDVEDHEYGRHFIALDYARVGNVQCALMELGIDYTTQLNRPVVPYDAGPAIFKSQMLALASDLEREGL